MGVGFRGLVGGAAGCPLKALVQILNDGNGRVFLVVTEADDARRYWFISWGNGRKVIGSVYMSMKSADSWFMRQVGSFTNQQWSSSMAPFVVEILKRIPMDAEELWLDQVAHRVEEEFRGKQRERLASYGAA